MDTGTLIPEITDAELEEWCSNQFAQVCELKNKQSMCKNPATWIMSLRKPSCNCVTKRVFAICDPCHDTIVANSMRVFCNNCISPIHVSWFERAR